MFNGFYVYFSVSYMIIYPGYFYVELLAFCFLSLKKKKTNFLMYQELQLIAKVVSISFAMFFSTSSSKDLEFIFLLVLYQGQAGDLFWPIECRSELVPVQLKPQRFCMLLSVFLLPAQLPCQSVLVSLLKDENPDAAEMSHQCLGCLRPGNMSKPSRNRKN